MKQQPPVRVMFVCLGNICRSPMAEAIFAKLVQDAGLQEQFVIASSGTGSWHTGERPHPGTQAVLQRNSVPLREDKVAHRLSGDELDSYDYIVAMDSDNVHSIYGLAPTPPTALYRLLDFAPHSDTRDVPDPYYTGGFDHVYGLVEAGARGLLEHIRNERGL
ncbi:MAG: low molecular weight phosphotyrosine protein phosphatase [Chloroflexaceae bacterium]|nr:low molecular weight phosphotyrosine protein phosphatase [Chloroflexaceae bacterium]